MSNDTTHTLECLEHFYQQQRLWAYHARIALEPGLDERMHAPPSPVPNAPCTFISTRSTLSPAPSTHPNRDTIQATRWMRRKNRFRLKIDTIHVHRPKCRPLRGPPNEPALRLLEMFSDRLDAGMESCQRLQRLVRHADMQKYV
ncbi:hypothetical protein NUW54_g1170 [Trametes sanguinea]|uniref:Uncharacterized protein n=2 Tax=Trametes sanguinea TaxID=158606 RepID=A0ACC1Q2T3_9APHY|nr:hypothetical protein NUW54_g2805 [Trametes sanguinea]KAJ3014942.1 hypothetical protein NUW54_g1170 [Trametes sanguinea]